MVTSTRPIPKRPAASARPPMQRSLSIDSRKPHGLSHGLQMDLKQAVQLEKQELHKKGLLPPIALDMPLPKAANDEGDETQLCSSPPYWLYRQQRQVRRAASFTNGQRAGPPPMPCSPPVPIPQHHETQRRYSAAAGLEEHMARELQQLSNSQCEARLWDEFWNYKLSFESRESFEASNVQVKEERGNNVKYRSESSAAETVIEDDEDGASSVGPEEDEHGNVFEMDDL
uniref:Uncharacterized protein n=1 Tax=Phytophthora ramorum TaxID=164328 RepID=H3GII3_PHYRM